VTRVVVTGLGMVSPLALDREGTWAAMLEGRDGLGPLTRLDLSAEPAQIAGQVALAPARHRTLCEVAALRALDEALDGFRPGGDPARIGVFQGAGTSGLPVAEAYLRIGWPGVAAGRPNPPTRAPALSPMPWPWSWAPRAPGAPS
jgi:3-oxoacyl-[acyl-carrier-protein] synthase II